MVTGSARPAAGPALAVRPVLLATLSVRVDPTAERMAIESALDAGVTLIIANMISCRLPAGAVLAPEYAMLPHEEDRDAVRATADRAAALGIATELLRVTSTRPVRALLELAAERDVGLLVLGPICRDAAPAISRRRAAGAATRGCLVWVAPDG